MKKLFRIIILLLLSVVVFFQYQGYRRFHPPEDYDYQTAEEIDTDYYDVLFLQQYYENVYNIGTFARSQWYNHGLDVKFPEESEEADRATEHYARLVAVTRVMEAKLIRSAELKEQGYDNTDIRFMIEKHISPQTYAQKDYEYLLGTKKGDIGPKVRFLQALLVDKGYTTPVDGKFMVSTEVQMILFQKEQGLLASGILDTSTLRALLKDRINVK